MEECPQGSRASMMTMVLLALGALGVPRMNLDMLAISKCYRGASGILFGKLVLVRGTSRVFAKSNHHKRLDLTIYSSHYSYAELANQCSRLKSSAMIINANMLSYCRDYRVLTPNYRVFITTHCISSLLWKRPSNFLITILYTFFNRLMIPLLLQVCRLVFVRLVAYSRSDQIDQELL
jgi:hypothetical protein